METLYIYFFKSSGLIVMFYIAYYFLLRKETFFLSNRWYLILGMLTAAVLPLFFYTKVTFVDANPVDFNWSQIPINKPIEKKTFEINWNLIFVSCYGLGVFLFTSKFLFDFYFLHKTLKNKIAKRRANFKFIDTNENIAPFSFFNTIVYNSSLYSPIELENILEHEKVHSEQHHTADVLFSRLFCILFWFNPIVWLYKKAMVQNLEFIADKEALKKIADKKTYQLTLLKITTQENCVAITNHFYQSLIKKRIIMLNKNQSKKINSWKYALVLPALVAFVLLFQVKVVAQEKESDFKISNVPITVSLHVTSKSTQQDLEAEKEFFKTTYGIDVTFTELKVDGNNEITAILVRMEDKTGVKKTYQVNEDKPIKPFDIFAKEDKSNQISFGFSASSKENLHLKNHMDFVNKQQNNSDKNDDEPKVEMISSSSPYPSWSITSATKNGKEYLIVIDGQKQNKNDLIKVDMDAEIASSITLPATLAEKKYGVEGVNGAFEITTKKGSSKSSKDLGDPKPINKGWEVKIGVSEVSYNTIKNFSDKKEDKESEIKYRIASREDNLENVKINKDVDYKKAVIIINGKVSSVEILNQLKPDQIENISIEKIDSVGDKSKQLAIQKFGEQAVNGIIYIETKEFVKK
ncbi:M56 family metallopeptidase [Flavobacterium sp. F-380]|uniref:M56 family metallopeptidase n=1 Tax=Flavobacterium kayseriense TaxID=2764714 RepID=A0ABR7JAN8_9FLAO|nr:M56 family metallopeptidase [Flavobacterium kayseriense]MBC5842453.1 M56 family metallopeptidase [Flavobacterium kayseriense]MBC5848983.1 M56 family metallopeptidase [Flavobacterium kayseriense]